MIPLLKKKQDHTVGDLLHTELKKLLENFDEEVRMLQNECSTEKEKGKRLFFVPARLGASHQWTDLAVEREARRHACARSFSIGKMDSMDIIGPHECLYVVLYLVVCIGCGRLRCGWW